MGAFNFDVKAIEAIKDKKIDALTKRSNSINIDDGIQKSPSMPKCKTYKSPRYHNQSNNQNE